MSKYDDDDDDDDQAVGDYERYGGDQITWNDLQAMENSEPDLSEEGS